MNPKPIRLLIADDHAVVRLGLVSMLSIEEDMVIVGEASGGEEAVRMYRELLPDLVLLDVRMPGIGGIVAFEKIRSEFPSALGLMLSTSGLDEDLARAYEAGAAGFLLKTLDQNVMVDAIRAAHRGDRLFPESVVARINGRRKLSNREREVLSLMRKGLCNKEIAAALDLSEHTVKSYLKTIFEKLGTQDRTGAVAAGFSLGYLKV